jgi:hypothetical protein
MKLAELVKAWRCFNDMTVHDVAVLIGVEDKVLRRFERGEAVSAPTLLAIIRWTLAG